MLVERILENFELYWSIRRLAASPAMIAPNICKGYNTRNPLNAGKS